MGNCKTILTIAGVLLLLFGVWWWNSYPVADNSANEQHIKNLTKQNMLLKANNQQLDSMIHRLTFATDSLTKLVEEDQKYLATLKKNKYETTKAISDFTTDKLFRFFAEFNPDSTAK